MMLLAVLVNFDDLTTHWLVLESQLHNECYSEHGMNSYTKSVPTHTVKFNVFVRG